MHNVALSSFLNNADAETVLVNAQFIFNILVLMTAFRLIRLPSLGLRGLIKSFQHQPGLKPLQLICFY